MADVEDILLPESQPPPTLGDGWNDLRLAVRRLLSVNAPALTGLYDAAVRMLHDEQFPGRRYLIAHCVREIANGLPSFLGNEMARERTDYQALVQPIVEPWIDAGLPIGPEAAPEFISGDGDLSSPAIAIPRTIVRQIGRLVEAHTAASGRRQHNAAILFRALSFGPDEEAYHLRPIIDVWLDTCDWFQKRVHHNRQGASSSDNELEEEFIDQFEKLEGLLYSMVEPFLNIAKSLDEELDEANS